MTAGARYTCTCPRCGHQWVVTRAEIATGLWHVCPRCTPDESRHDRR